MDKPLISVIVPIYNVEQYLDECLESLIHQTYQNQEIILVDDGSSDKSPQICEEWALKDSRIHVIHKENGGLSSARNVGLDEATGDYIAFVDGDDFFDKKMYETLYEGITRSSSIGISAIKFYRYEDGKVSIYRKKWDSKVDVLVKSQDFGLLTLKQEVCHAATNKLYRRELLENVRFREGLLNEDVLFMHDLAKLMKERNYDMWDLAYYAYYYRMRQNSICHSNVPIEVPYIQNLKTIVEEADSLSYKTAALHLYRITVFNFCYYLFKSQFTLEGKEIFDKYFAQYQRILSVSFWKDIKDEFSNPIKSVLSLFMLKYAPGLYAYYVHKNRKD